MYIQYSIVQFIKRRNIYILITSLYRLTKGNKITSKINTSTCTITGFWKRDNHNIHIEINWSVSLDGSDPQGVDYTITTNLMEKYMFCGWNVCVCVCVFLCLHAHTHACVQTGTHEKGCQHDTIILFTTILCLTLCALQ